MPHKRLPGVIGLPLLLLGAAVAEARSYQTEYLDGHIVRCSTVNTTTLPAASLEQYGLNADPGQGLLSCVAQEDRQQLEPQNVPANVRARVRPLGQRYQEISMRELEIDGLVSYLGVYPVVSGAPLRFEVKIDVPRVGGILLEFDDLEPAL